MFHNYETEKITRRASDAAEYIEMFGSFTGAIQLCYTTTTFIGIWQPRGWIKINNTHATHIQS